MLDWRVEVSRANSNICIFLKTLSQFTIARARCRKQQAALRLTHDFHVNAQSFGRPEFPGLVGPFDYTDTGTTIVKVIFKSEVDDLIRLIQAIEIKVKKRRAARSRRLSGRHRWRGPGLARILFEQRKRRAAHYLTNPHTRRQALREGSLTRTKLPFQQEQFTSLQKFAQAHTQALRLSRAVADDIERFFLRLPGHKTPFAKQDILKHTIADYTISACSLL